MSAAPTRAELCAALQALALASSGFIHGRGQHDGRARLRTAIAHANELLRTGQPARRPTTRAARRAPRS